MRKENGILLHFVLLQILTQMYFFGPFRDVCYITGGKLYVRILFSNILHVSKLL